MDDNYKTPLIEAAIDMAARNHQFAEGAIFHSDRGSNYTSTQFGQTLKKQNRRANRDMLRQCDGRIVLRRAEE